MQLTEFKAAYFYSYFLILNRNNLITGYLAAELFAEHRQQKGLLRGHFTG